MNIQIDLFCHKAIILSTKTPLCTQLLDKNIISIGGAI